MINRDRPKIKTIQLSQGLYAIVEEKDYEWLNQYKWSAFKNGKTYYAVMGVGPRGNNQLIMMHRLIMQTPVSLDTDHVNGNGLDNRRSNLRVCTRSQNNQNQRVRSTGSSKYKGVSYDKQKRRWCAQLVVNKKRVLYSRFLSEIDAAKAYDKKAREVFGRFAHTNF